MSLKLITTEKFGELDCNFYRNINDEILLTREQIGTALEYSNPRQAISKIHNKYKERFDQFSVKIDILSAGGKQNTMLYTLQGVLLICELSHSPKSYEFANFIKNLSNKKQNIIIINTRKELLFIDKLENMLLVFGLKGIRQYKVNDYRIDFYIPEINIAIEYNENDHKYYSQEKEWKRKTEIVKKIKCKFITVSDKNTDEYNLGKTIRRMYRIALNSFSNSINNDSYKYLKLFEKESVFKI